MFIQPKVSLRNIHVRHVDSDKWTTVGRFEAAECKKLRRQYQQLGFQVRIDGGLKNNEGPVIKDYMRPSACVSIPTSQYR